MRMEAWHFSETSLFTYRCIGCQNPGTQYALLCTIWMHANVGKMLQPDTPQLHSRGIYIHYYHVWGCIYRRYSMSLCANAKHRNTSPKTNCEFLFINIHQLDALNFIITLFQASTCFDHMCSSSGGQKFITQSLVSSHL
jgi:hypothetical protein